MRIMKNIYFNSADIKICNLFIEYGGLSSSAAHILAAYIIKKRSRSKEPRNIHFKSNKNRIYLFHMKQFAYILPLNCIFNRQ